MPVAAWWFTACRCRVFMQEAYQPEIFTQLSQRTVWPTGNYCWCRPCRDICRVAMYRTGFKARVIGAGQRC
jgi:hypothetical protein